MSNEKKYFAIFRKRLATLTVAKKENVLAKEARLRGIEVSAIPQQDRFLTVQRNIKECFIVDSDKNVVSYGSSIRLPQDSNSNKFSEDLSLVRAVTAFEKGKSRLTRYGTPRFTNNVTLTEEDKELVTKIKLDRRTPIDFEKVKQLLALLKKTNEKVTV